MTEPFPDFTPTERIGDPRCGSKSATHAPACGKPATWHVLWTATPPAPLSLLCDEHMAHARQHLVYADQHPAAMICDIPGTGWLTTTPSQCVLTTTTELNAQAQAETATR
ncbi:hypothetical protein [Streptomyces sp. NPDC060322]|uniref:hypothetical protein n=1 Tax=Streptomyces sp. NPDC060322 TaxID=3347097 RepID=UPI00365A4D1A